MRLNNFKNTHFLTFTLSLFGLIYLFNFFPYHNSKTTKIYAELQVNKPIIVGANRTTLYFKLLAKKNVALVTNQTSVLFETQNTSRKLKSIHLVDTLLNASIKIKKVFAPEHGFRGIADAGEKVKNTIDTKTGIPIISLYAKNKKPTKEQLKDIDIVVFDIQDVGVRFYTYLSTLHYVMQACSEQNIPLIVLDRPNPNGNYIDGPVLKKELKSFVGLHPIPIVYGMTIGEYALMLNGENWLKTDKKCNLTVIPLLNYTHNSIVHLPIKPSPNLPNDKAINLYPSLALFEGTTISAGRGTDKQFQLFGAPFLPDSVYKYEFKPQSNQGSKYPKFNNKVCHGLDLRSYKKLNSIHLNWLIKAYKNSNKKDFFNPFFSKLAGNNELQKQIENGLNSKEIKQSWIKDLDAFKQIRKKYLLYP